MGHNEFYEQVLVPMRPEFMGKLVKVKIVGATKFSMTGQTLDEVVMPGLAKPLEKGVVSGVTLEQANNKVSFYVTLLSITFKTCFFLDLGSIIFSFYKCISQTVSNVL